MYAHRTTQSLRIGHRATVSQKGIPMIQDIAPKKLDNQYKPSAEPMDDSVVFVFDARTVLVRQDEGKLFPTFAQLGRPDGCVYLFTIGKKAFFLLLSEKDQSSRQILPSSPSRTSVRTRRQSCRASTPSTRPCTSTAGTTRTASAASAASRPSSTQKSAPCAAPSATMSSIRASTRPSSSASCTMERSF